MSRNALLLGIASLFVTSAVAHAQADAPVTLELSGLFGDDMAIGPGYVEVVVKVRNRTRRPLRGVVEVFEGGGVQAGSVHRGRLEAPAGGQRVTVFTVFLPHGGSSLQGSFRVDGDVVARAFSSTGYSPSGHGGVAVLADPPRIRASLLDLNVQVTDTGSYGSESGRVSVGVVGFEPGSGDPMLPRSAASYGALALLVAEARQLERLDEVAFSALRDWVASGGRLLVLPSSDDDLRGARLASLVGPIAPSPWPGETNRMVPAELSPGTLAGPSVESEAWGATRRWGFGRVHVARFDGNAPPFDRSPAVRELVRGILEESLASDAGEPLFAHGRGAELAGYGGGDVPFDMLRSVLDPNQTFRPTLPLVGFVLLVYVVLVGPLAFTWAARRNRPTIVLVTTPALAFATLFVLLGIGFAGKGVRDRLRSVSLIEVVEGESLAFERRYVGIFFGRPGTVTLASPDRGIVRHLDQVSGAGRVVVDEDADPVVVRDLRGSLWETRFVREERATTLDGAVHFAWQGDTLASVENRTRWTLEDAVVVDGNQGLHRVGTLAPGAIRPVESASLGTIAHVAPWRFDADTLEPLARPLGLGLRTRPMLNALFVAARNRFAAGGVPVLLARLDDPRRSPSLARFTVDRSLSLLRVVARPNPVPLREPTHEPSLAATYDAEPRPPENAIGSSPGGADAPTDASISEGVVDGGVP